MSETDNELLVRAHFDDPWQRRDLEAIDRYMAPDYVQHSKQAAQGRDGLEALFRGLWAAFSEQTNSIDDLVAEGGQGPRGRTQESAFHR